MPYSIREAGIDDIPAITLIYNQGIEDRGATLRTEEATQEERKEWLHNKKGKSRVFVAEGDGNGIVGWASLDEFHQDGCAGEIADITVYVRRDKRGEGVGSQMLKHLHEAAKASGFRKTVSNVISVNQIAKKLFISEGYRKVGVYEKQGKVDGDWMNTLILERFL